MGRRSVGGSWGGWRVRFLRPAVRPRPGSEGGPAGSWLALLSRQTLVGREPALPDLAVRRARAMARRHAVTVPADLRARLEEARLDLPALLRAPDPMDLDPAEIPHRLIRELGTGHRLCRGASGLGSDTGSPGSEAHAPRPSGRTGPGGGSLGTIPDESAPARSSRPGGSGKRHSPEFAAGASLPYNMVPGRDPHAGKAPGDSGPNPTDALPSEAHRRRS